ncbi:MAG: universal stress protein [Myxococcota bacterium]
MVPPLRFERILLPLDFSPHSRKALEIARDLAQRCGPAHLILVHAFFVPVEIEALATEHGEPILEHLSREATRELEEILTGLQDAGISSEFVVTRGYAEEVIVNLAREKAADLIVMGTRGRSGLAHIALGSIAERVVRAAPCPVLTVKASHD